MKIVISGAGEVGSHLAKMLSREANDITVIDNDENRLKQLTDYADVEAVKGFPSSIGVLKQAGVDKADLFIAVYPYADRELNVFAALVAKKMGAGKVVARINDEGYLSSENKLMFKEMGIELMFYPEKIAAEEISDQLKHSASSETMDFVRGKLQISVFRMDESSPVLDMTLGEFIKTLPAEQVRQMRIIAISRNDETIIPGYDSKFLYNDLVFVMATREGIDDIIRSFGKSNIEVGRVMILGGGSTSQLLAEALYRQGTEVKIIEKDKERCLQLSEKLPEDVQIACGDGRNSDTLNDEGIRDFDAFVSLTGSDETNVLACVVAKKFGIMRTVAEVENIEYIRVAEDMGVDSIINKKLITAGKIFKFTLSGRARFVRYMSGTSAEVVEYTVAPGSAITGKPLKDINFPKNAIIGGVVRGTDSFIAVGDTVIEAYDRVAVFTLPQSVKEIDKFFN
ncbi:MAG: Trk system potassium transporter TrkA [Bacteroidales bacterium]|nr:Trk system potassium transporter TrkA [Bacteroidales bacterium]